MSSAWKHRRPELKFILGDPGTVRRVGRKGAKKVFKYGRKSPWVPTLTELFPKIQADAGSWLGTKNALYYCAQSANSFSWVFFREFVHDGYCFDHGLSGSCTKEMQAVRKLSVWYKIPIKYRESEKLGYWKRCKTVLRHWQKDIIEYKHHRVMSTNLRVILGIWVHV